jgi:ABC-type nickel/cobalt efflux system permease component RcnA
MAQPTSERRTDWWGLGFALWILALANTGAFAVWSLVSPQVLWTWGIVFVLILFVGLSVILASWIVGLYRAWTDSPAAGEDPSEDLYPDDRVE